MKLANVSLMVAAVLSNDLCATTFAVGGMLGDKKGRTILTNEACSQKVDAFQIGTNSLQADGMRRAFYFTRTGMTNEGCWRYEAGSVLLVWPTENVIRRWPVDNFKLSKPSVLSWDEAH